MKRLNISRIDRTIYFRNGEGLGKIGKKIHSDEGYY
jgi:hypothetical protein